MMRSKKEIMIFLATGARVGNMRVAPGTWGTLPGIPLVLIFSLLAPSIQTIGVVTFIMAAIWIAQEAEKGLGEKDPGAIVIDEMAGYLVALSGISPGMYSLAAGFVIFRCFDIIKPFPIKYIERQFPGGCGVVLDDIVAGIYTGLVLRLIF